MGSCSVCGNTIVFGGLREGRHRFCGDPCRRSGEILVATESVPIEEAEDRAGRMQEGPCPRCGGPGPIDVLASHWVWSAVFLTRWWSRPELRCASCVRKERGLAVGFSLLLGWWGIPWGPIMTVVQVAKNLGGLLGGPIPGRPSADLVRLARMQIAAGEPEDARVVGDGAPAVPATNRSHLALVYAFCLLVGIVLGAYGWKKLRDADGTSPVPAAVSLEDLESGTPPPQPYVVVGEHVRLYSASFGRCSTSRYSRREAPDSRVQFAVYPITPVGPEAQRILELESRYGSWEAIPETEERGELKPLVVWVRTRAFRRIRDIPTRSERADSVEGMMRVSRGPTDEEWSEIERSEPRVRRADVRILEEGETPPSPFVGRAMFVAGVLVLLLPLGIMLVRARARVSCASR